jgi:type I restriction enzyme S subunit
MSEVLLGELLSSKGITYGVVKPGDYETNGIPLIKAADVVNGRVSTTPNFRISREKHQEHSRTELNGGELLITLVGTPGQCAVAPPEVKGFNVVRAVGVFSVNALADSRFIMYSIQAPQSQAYIRNVCNTTVQATLNLGDFKGLPLSIPEINEQKAIAHILGTLDDKIELNRKTKETLEAMAKALFKSWFVDFDPVKAKAEGRPTGLPAEISDLFPDSFEDSELGEIPSGWEIKKIGDIISRFPVGKRFDQKTVLPKGSIPVLDQSASGIVGYHDEEAGVLATKDFPLFTFANHTCAMRYMTRPFSVIQNVFPLRGNGVDTAWLYQASQGKQEITEYKGHYPDFIEKEVVVPSNGVDKIYGGDYKRILIKCDFSLINSVSLASIRDALLPKLISGEIRIPDAEKMLEEVGI